MTDFLDGLLLGDGSLRCNGRMKNAVYQHKSAMTSYSGFSLLVYMDYIVHNLEKLYNIKFTESSKDNVFIKRGIQRNDQYNKETQKHYQSYRIQSLSSEFLTEQHTRWYKNQVKVLPEDLVLTPLSVLNLYIGDGSLDLNRGYNGYKSYLCCIKLSTQSFSYDEQQRLVSLFENIGFDISNFKINKRHGKGKNNYALYIYRGSIPQFFSYIGLCPVECYQYKFDYEKYWNNPQRLSKEERATTISKESRQEALSKQETS